ncbi:MAG: SDR family oxidoreductase [Alphaproteobacteria bacterium]|nr:SDR family oxidoreductase [Alphaproteobacteria bacterium]
MAKIALITGGSGGIGAATALLLARDGYDVGVTYLENRAGGEATASAIRALGHRGLAVHADTALESDVIAAFQAVDRELGTLDALVNNAGIVGAGSRVADLTVERLNRVLAVNVTGCFLAAREAVRRMSTRAGGRGGAIVNVSSAAARLGSPGEFVHYAASKGAVDTFTLGLAREVADEGIRVNAVRPGMIDTEIHAKSGLAERVATIVPTVPMRRIGTADEVAETIVWLLSDSASYVTGALLDVAGGR